MQGIGFTGKPRKRNSEEKYCDVTFFRLGVVILKRLRIGSNSDKLYPQRFTSEYTILLE
jgi:hypothetical protein